MTNEHDQDKPAIPASSPESEPESEVPARIDQLFCAGEVRILIIDDDESIADVMRSALEPKSFVVDMVTQPGQIRQQLEARTYHLIILDYVLPGLRTELVLEWIQNIQPEAAVIVVTAYPTVDNAVRALRAHASDYLTKPFELQDFIDRVTCCLEERGLLRLTEEALREKLGAAIRERRKSLNLTLADLAERCGVSLGYLSQVELGKNSASIETLYRISLGLGVRLSELFQTLQVSI